MRHKNGGEKESVHRRVSALVAQAKTSPFESLDIAPVERFVLIDQIIRTIKRLIAERKLKPGDVIPSERTLAELFGVSRTSVRQALKALAVMGIFEIRTGSRTALNKSISELLVNPLQFMSALYHIDTDELFETRKIIEVGLTETAAAKATDEDISMMTTTLRKAEECLDNPNKYLVVEMQFHENIFDASRNRILAAVMVSLNNLLIESREESIVTFTDLRQSLNEHLKILAGIKSRVPLKAGKAMKEHLNDVQRRLRSLRELKNHRRPSKS